jgi:type II secretory pathway pseudopilin PulG
MSSTERPGGFVLMEAVIALAIISLFAVALLSTVGAQVRAADRGNVLLVERALAEDRLMALQLQDYDRLIDLPDSLAKGTFPEPFQDFTWSATATPVKDEYDLFDATVTVSGRGYSLPLQTLVHRARPVLQEGGR